GIERFIQHQKAKPVAGIKKRSRRRVMSRSYRIVTRRLKQLDSALLGTVERRRPERSVVMVDAAARELHRLAVQNETLFRRPCKRPDTKGGYHLIDNFAVFLHLRDGAVQNRRIRRPESRIGYRSLLRRFGLVPCADRQLRLCGSNFVPSLVKQCGLDSHPGLA